MSGPTERDKNPFALGESSGAERRVRVRYPTDRESLCQRGEGRLDHAWWLARVVDISTTGIGIILRQRFPNDTLLTIELQSSAGDVSRTLQTKVIHTTPHPEGGWVSGCAFVNPLTEEDLKVLL
jgi:hypothetical protein